MPIAGQSPQEIVHTEMHKFKEGSLHSGSKNGPMVHSRAQAIAIALSESGQSNKQKQKKKAAPAFGALDAKW